MRERRRYVTRRVTDYDTDAVKDGWVSIIGRSEEGGIYLVPVGYT